MKKKIEEELKRKNGHGFNEYKSWKKQAYLASPELVDKFWELIEKAPAITIVGDYDVDGLLGASTMATAIKSVFNNKRIRVRIPHRFSEGYGIHQAIVDGIKEKDPIGTLVITVDNGIAEKEKLEDLEACGYTVALTDHHARDLEEIPNVTFIADPIAIGNSEDFSGDYWCGTGVALKLVEQKLSDEILEMVEAFAAVATIADCVPLVEGNWALVNRVLEKMKKGKCPAQFELLLTYLGQSSRYITEDVVGYYLAPALNAPGRLYDNGGFEIIKYMFNATPEQANFLKESNERRKAIRDEQAAVLMYEINDRGLSNNCPIWIMVEGLHDGIIGILAGMIVEKFGVPAIVLTKREDGLLKGSARSIDGVNIFEYLNGLKSKGVDFVSLGGHEGAAGMTMTEEAYEKARIFQISNEPVTAEYVEEENYICIDLDEIPEAYAIQQKAAPFGEKNQQPLFAVNVDVDDKRVKFVGSSKEHLIVEPKDREWKATHFYHKKSDCADAQSFYLCGNITTSYFGGDATVTLNGTDVFL